MADELDRQQQVEARMRKRGNETIKVQLRKVTKLVSCPIAKKLRNADLCENCMHFHGWKQDGDVFVKCGKVTTKSKAVEVTV